MWKEIYHKELAYVIIVQILQCEIASFELGEPKVQFLN